VRRYGTHTVHLSASVAYQKSSRARWWSHAITSKSSSTNIIKAAQGKCIGPTSGFITSPEVGPRGHYWYPADRVPLCTRLKRPVPRRQTPHPTGEGSGAATCPHAPDPLPVPESSCSTTCPVAQSTPPSRRGLRCRHVPRGTEPITGQERALEPPHVSWLRARPLRRKVLASPRD
jgi:hypothetical protein